MEDLLAGLWLDVLGRSGISWWRTADYHYNY